ncbi:MULTISPECIES: zinc ABC transporter substrate-binding protein ZnuA [unclassified Pseudomonas]|uniref:zinc ABC transporter substrate-binding protein ZnuA n=1 Tax=unclassified Pseudomonas TaxID=196821 RepID=UPI0007316565|nr:MULTISPECIES: zinc ABC transporter substrate-binding protein ZnuA [unclassified Pseudomonas]KSW24985.1 ABC transporter substrate-binding protein [Pseudomonas sp. ADP]OBP08318.1 zinc ABC transporter substrate-binding protein [Pseudomonas sp. EGD-AKN5]QOF87552.1 zinc ABC transporter substrate-binding protein [Pseudomonas sp. ADPe]
MSLRPSALLLACCTLFLSLGASAEVKVLTSIKPLQLIAAAVQDGEGSPDVLLPPGASPHSYALRPSDVRRLREAQLFYWIGPDMEVFLDKPLQARQAPSVAVQELPGMHLRKFVNFENMSHADYEDHDHDHRPGTLDAHLWLLPANAQAIAARMAEDLAIADPLNAGRYQANLKAFDERMEQLDARLKQRLAPLVGKPYFVFHEAFDYFEEAYGLRHAGVFALSADVQPGAKHVAAMRAQLQKAGPSCIFSEPPLRPRLADTLSAGLPVQLAELDDLGVAVKVDANGYEKLLGNLADEFAGCLEKL